MGKPKDTHGVKVLTPPAKTSNLPVALQHRPNKASCKSALEAVRIDRRTSTNPHRFPLRFEELEESSAMQDMETRHGQPINKPHVFPFTGGEF